MSREPLSPSTSEPLPAVGPTGTDGTRPTLPARAAEPPAGAGVVAGAAGAAPEGAGAVGAAGIAMFWHFASLGGTSASIAFWERCSART